MKFEVGDMVRVRQKSFDITLLEDCFRNAK